jgi:hypothetical protein
MARRGTERVSVGGVQMSFGGHVHKAASDQLQKKLQEAMGDGADNLADNLAGMDVKDPKGDDHSMGSANAEDAARHVACAKQAAAGPAQCHGDDDHYFDGAVGGDVSRCLS